MQIRLFNEEVGLRPPRHDPPNALANHYRTRDGRWFIMALFNEQRQLHSFLSAMGHEELTNDPRFATTEARKKHAPELVKVLDGFCHPRPGGVAAILDGVGVTFGIVATVNEALHDPQMRHCGALAPFADGHGMTVMTPFHIDGETKVPPIRAPAVGQHNEHVLREAGYSGDEIERLRGLGVLA